MSPSLPQPPRLPRRITRPLRSTALLIGLSCLPLSSLFLNGAEQARASVLHVLVGYVVLLVAFRVIGKRELGRLSPFELVTLMLIPEILSNTLQGEATLLQSLAGLSTVLLLVVFTSLLTQRFSTLQNVFESPPQLLVVDGRLLEDNMNAERIAPDELFSEMRKQGLSRLEDVRFAVIESSGNITFVASSAAPQNQGSSEHEEASSV